MSAFLVNRQHVAAILAWYCSGHGPRNAYEKDREQPRWRERMATMLHAENAKSTNYRYQGQMGEDVGHTFTLADFRYVPSLDAVGVIKACHCLRYQSCEHPEWETSESKALLERIEAAAVRVLPGYNEADWEVEPIDVPAIKARIAKDVFGRKL